VKIYDTFLFGAGEAELDILECHLYELEDSPVYRHVIVEGTCTFQGNDKPLWFEERRERFSPWLDRIRYIPFTPTTFEPGKEPGDAWAREHSSRQAVLRGLVDAEPGDIIIHGDADEFLSPWAFEPLSRMPLVTPVKFNLDWAMFAVDWMVPWPWAAPSAVRWEWLARTKNLTLMREYGWPVAELGRRCSGWHMNWLGGHEAMRAKVNAFSHAEQVPEVEAGIVAGKYYEGGLLWAGGDRPGETQLHAVDVTEAWPRWVREGRCPAEWFRPREVPSEAG
jgi:hypothetical protein